MTSPCFHFKPYWFTACCCGSTTVPTATWTKLLFNTATSDGDLPFSNATSTHTVPLAGYYRLYCNAASNTTDNGVGTFRALAFDIDGTKKGYVNNAPSTGMKTGYTCYWEGKLTAGQVVGAYMYQDTGGNVVVLENSSTLSLVREWATQQEH